MITSLKIQMRQLESKNMEEKSIKILVSFQIQRQVILLGNKH